MAARGSTLELAKAVVKTIDFNSNSAPPEARRATAFAQADYWRSFSSRLPRLSPSESEWLMREVNAGGERMMAVVGRREFALWSLADTADRCVDTYSRLVIVVGTGSKHEAYLWAKVLNCYNGRGDLSTHLRTARLSGFETGMFSLWESHIIDRVLETMLRE